MNNKFIFANCAGKIIPSISRPRKPLMCQQLLFLPKNISIYCKYEFQIDLLCFGRKRYLKEHTVKIKTYQELQQFYVQFIQKYMNCAYESCALSEDTWCNFIYQANELYIYVGAIRSILHLFESNRFKIPAVTFFSNIISTGSKNKSTSRGTFLVSRR